MDLFLAILLKAVIFSSSLQIVNEPKAIKNAWVEILSTSDLCLMYMKLSDDEGEVSILNRRLGQDCTASVGHGFIETITVSKIPQVKFKETSLTISLSSTDQELEKVIPLWNQGQDKRNAFFVESSSKHVNYLNYGDRCEKENCQFCPRGFTRLVTAEGIDYGCFDPSLCGTKDHPACFLGLSSAKGEQLCEEQSQVGFCKAGLSKHCSSAVNFLVCE